MRNPEWTFTSSDGKVIDLTIGLPLTQSDYDQYMDRLSEFIDSELDKATDRGYKVGYNSGHDQGYSSGHDQFNSDIHKAGEVTGYNDCLIDIRNYLYDLDLVSPELYTIIESQLDSMRKREGI